MPKLKNCKICYSVIPKPNKFYSWPRYLKRIYCSVKCRVRDDHNRLVRMGFQKGSSGFKGKHTEHTKLLLSLNHKGKMTGKKHPLWTGRYPAYRTLHSWVVRYLGQPDTCNHCGTKATGHKMHWANKDGIYRRVKKDWIRLCAKCHGAYDKLLNLRKQRRILI